MTCFLLIEGQRVQLPDEITDDDDKIRRVLAPIFPGASTAQLNRSVKDGVTEITVVKQAGPKGQCALQKLKDAPASVNPIIALYQNLQRTDLAEQSAEDLLNLDERIRKTLKKGNEQAEQMAETKKRLNEAAPSPAQNVPTGF